MPALDVNAAGTRADLRGAPKGAVTTREIERLVLPPGLTRRTREKVVLDYCADGWHSTSGTADNRYGYGDALCSTLRLKDKWATDRGGFDPDRFHAFHDEHPVVWCIRRQQHRARTRRTNWYCDPELPDEYRQMAAAIPPGGVHSQIDGGARRDGRDRKRHQSRGQGGSGSDGPPASPEHYAVPDPLNPTQILYWYRPKRGRQEGKLQPWPPRRARYWPLYYRDMPDGRANTEANRVFAEQHWARVANARREVFAAIAADPQGAAALFASLQSACCCCGKALTDERSKVYGIGPECRRGASPAVLTSMVDAVGRAHALSESAGAGVGSPPEVPHLTGSCSPATRSAAVI